MSIRALALANSAAANGEVQGCRKGHEDESVLERRAYQRQQSWIRRSGRRWKHANSSSNMVDELERQIETLEAEGESIQATMKKGKTNTAKADRMAEIERITERHKWHQGKLELIRRSLENGAVETEQVNDLEETIRYYVSDGMNDDFMEDDEMYDDLNLQEEEDNYGMNNDNDRVSSQDTQSIQEETPDIDSRSGSIPSGKAKGQSARSPGCCGPETFDTNQESSAGSGNAAYSIGEYYQ